MFDSLFKGLLKGLNVEDVFKGVITKAGASAAKGPFSALFQKMKVSGRTALAGKLRKAAEHLDKGECDAAAAVVADVIDDIKF